MGKNSLLGSDESSRVALDAVNRALFKRVTELVLAQEEDETRRVWFFLDETREAGRLEGLSRLLTKGRSKGACVVLGFQDIDGMRDAYGNNVANEILGQCGTKAILKLNSPETAKWASELRGSYLRYERQHSESQTQADGRGGSSQEGYSYGLQERKAVYTSEFFDLPFPTPAKGISGFYITNEGFYFKSFVTTSPDEYRDVLVVDYLQRLDTNEQFLLPWTDADKERIWGKTTTGSKPAAASNAKKRTLPERQVKP